MAGALVWLTRRCRPHIVAATLVLSLLAACGVIPGNPGMTDNDAAKDMEGFTKAAAPRQVLVVAASDGTLKWAQGVYQAQAGDVTFVVVNPSPLVHRFGVEGTGVDARSGDVGIGRTQTYTLKDLAPGDYLIVCDFLGHRQAGMVAHLIVR